MRAVFFLCLALFAFVSPLSGAGAAPQMLGLVASNGAVPLHCTGGTCWAELSAFCLQQERQVPPAGTKYFATGGDGITLVVIGADGQTRRLADGNRLQFTSLRNYTAVRVSVAAEDLAGMDATPLAIEIGEGLTLVPQPVPGDPQPQTAADVALAAEVLRAAGTRIVDRSEAASAARTLNRIVTVLSPDAHDRVTPRQSLWRDRVARFESAPGTPGLARAAETYESCHDNTSHDSDAKLRWCLQLRHDSLMIELNSDYWAAVKTGS